MGDQQSKHEYYEALLFEYKCTTHPSITAPSDLRHGVSARGNFCR
jgi:hypothetical protein